MKGLTNLLGDIWQVRHFPWIANTTKHRLVFDRRDSVMFHGPYKNLGDIKFLKHKNKYGKKMENDENY